jgi:hypothetical protein
MNRKLQIGDKFKWNFFIGMDEKEFTILDIDTSRLLHSINDVELKNELLLQWENSEGSLSYAWFGDYHFLNRLLNNGGIVIVEPPLHPNKQIKKFTL